MIEKTIKWMKDQLEKFPDDYLIIVHQEGAPFDAKIHGVYMDEYEAKHGHNVVKIKVTTKKIKLTRKEKDDMYRSMGLIKVRDCKW